ncbi:peroxynitrite isomerase THAP4 [Rhinophrynus dorsalis]
MVICCAAPNCTNRQGKEKKGVVSFHRFPLKDPERLSLWTAALQRSNWTPGPYSFLCSEHFSPDSFVPRMPDQHPLLTINAVPSLFFGSRVCRKRGVSGSRRTRVGKRKLIQKRLSPLIQGDSSLVSAGEEVFTENRYQPDISDDVKDSSCYLVSDVSTNLSSACKFISSLHSYSSSARTPRSSPSVQGVTESLLPHTVELSRTDHASDIPANEEAIKHCSSYVEFSGVFPSDVQHSGGIQCHIEVSSDGSSQLVSSGQLTYHVNDLHCEISESSPVVTEESNLQSDRKMVFSPQENDPSLQKDIKSLHSYCVSSNPLQGRRHHFRRKAQTEEWRVDNQSSPPLNPAVAPLAWMLGSWVSEPAGKGEFPTIPSFHYNEEAIISHVGQPMLNFTFCASNPETGKAMHRECGFIRIKPGTNQVAFICAQNTGVVEVEEGEVQGEQLSLVSQSLSRISFAKEPHVQQISRTFRLTPEGKLEQIVFMATDTQPLAPHLRVTYRKVSS